MIKTLISSILLFAVFSCHSDSDGYNDKLISKNTNSEVNRFKSSIKKTNCSIKLFFNNEIEFIPADTFKCVINTIKMIDPSLKGKSYSEQRMFFFNLLNSGVKNDIYFFSLEDLLVGQKFLNREFSAYCAEKFDLFIQRGIQSENSKILSYYYKILLAYSLQSESEILFSNKYFEEVEKKSDLSKVSIQNYLNGYGDILGVALFFNKDSIYELEKQIERLEEMNDSELKRLYWLLSIGGKKYPGKLTTYKTYRLNIINKRLKQ